MSLKHSIGLITGVFFQLHACFAWAEAYRVGTNDLLHIQVASWDEINVAIIDMPSVSGSYPVGADGEIAVPLAGFLPAAGLTPTEIAAALEDAMRSFVGIGQTLRVAVSVEQYAPIFLAGDIESPGMYDYAPGLTVLKAVSLAGGLSANKPLEGEERNFLTAKATIGVLQTDLMFLLAKQRRLELEINGGSAVEESTSDLNPDIWAAEAEILQARNMRYDHELTSLSRAQVSLQEALSVLENKLATNRTQLEAAQMELERERDLVERGLAAATRIFDRTTYISELESRLLDIERSILLAQQELQTHERNAGQLRAMRDEDNVISLQEVMTKIAEAEAQIAGQYDLLSAAAGKQIEDLLSTDPLREEFSYTIVRSRGDVATLPGDPTTALMPGDLVEVVSESRNLAAASN